jgi:hypothetical protein
LKKKLKRSCSGGHSTFTSLGKDNEYLAFKDMLDQFPTGVIETTPVGMDESTWLG